MDTEFVAFLGGVETFGKFTQVPFPTLVEHDTGIKTVNLGCANVGVDAYLNDPSLIHIANRARATVIEVMGAQNMSNRYYAVHPRRNDRFVRASSMLKSLFPTIDYAEFSFVRHMLVTLLQEDATRFVWIERELKDTWLKRMTELIHQIEGPVILLWLADHETGLGLEGEPMFIDQKMIEKLGEISDLVSVIANPDDRVAGQDELVFEPGEEEAAKEMMGPVVHRHVANQIALALRNFA